MFALFAGIPPLELCGALGLVVILAAGTFLVMVKIHQAPRKPQAVGHKPLPASAPRQVTYRGAEHAPEHSDPYRTLVLTLRPEALPRTVHPALPSVGHPKAKTEAPPPTQKPGLVSVDAPPIVAVAGSIRAGTSMFARPVNPEAQK